MKLDGLPQARPSVRPSRHRPAPHPWLVPSRFDGEGTSCIWPFIELRSCPSARNSPPRISRWPPVGSLGEGLARCRDTVLAWLMFIRQYLRISVFTDYRCVGFPLVSALVEPGRPEPGSVNTEIRCVLVRSGDRSSLTPSASRSPLTTTLPHNRTSVKADWRIYGSQTPYRICVFPYLRNTVSP
jgi:hypothetical protein